VSRAAVLLLIASLLLVCGCVAVLKREVKPPGKVLTTDQRSPFLKAHLLDGRLAILERWSLDPEPKRRVSWKPIETAGVTLHGQGRMLDAWREPVREGVLSFPLDSVAVFESNVKVEQLRPEFKAVLLVVGVMVAAVAVTCTIDPKACFGSCPTFYLDDGSGHLVLQAEGFSSSVAPVLAATDVDALSRAVPKGREVTVTMRNEALETHVVDSVRLLALPRAPGTRVFAATDGSYWQCSTLRAPSHARGDDGDAAAALRDLDGEERFVRADSTDLATHETIELSFEDAPHGELGLVIAARQSLLTTYLFYQSLAWLGSGTGDFLARLETADAATRDRAATPAPMLGGIEVEVRDATGAWKRVGMMGETGPLATDVRMVRLPAGITNDGRVRVRLRLAKGLWRIDQVALARLDSRVEPLPLDPSRVLAGGTPDPEALVALTDPHASLITTRGDAFDLVYRLPRDASSYELFLESHGYYLEWMRKEWESEEDPARVARLFADPAATLREMAPEFSHREVEMERLFWASRYAFP